MNELSKSQMKHLRKLAGQCYEKEMSIALESLFNNFQKWKKSEISVWDLNDKIHEHHNGTARDLWKTYEQINNPILAISMAFAKGIIQIEEVPEYCRESVERMAETFEIFGEKGSTTK